MDHSNDDIITFTEFVQYVIDHEKKLEIIFRDLDKNKNGHFFFPCHLLFFKNFYDSKNQND